MIQVPASPVTLEELVVMLARIFEGRRLKAYWDSNGKRWTIGYGHTAGVNYKMEITEEQANRYLMQDCDPLFKLAVGRPILEAAALVDFGLNCGETALKRLMNGEINFQNYGRHSGGVRLEGLEKRRDFEELLVRLSNQFADRPGQGKYSPLS